VLVGSQIARLILREADVYVSIDGITADFYPFEASLPARVATRVIGEVRGINRVTYDVTSKLPGTIARSPW
jgi:GMP synthase PP-ATPase subunit